MSVAIIINPMSGPGRGGLEERGRARAAIAERVLAAEGMAGRVVVTRAAGHGAAIAREAAAGAAATVVAWGGDGTVNEVGSALAGSGVALGIVPGGTGNGLARALGIRGSPADTLRVALRGRAREIDAGEAGGRLFFNVCGFGFDAHVATRFNELGRRRTFLAYLQVSLVELFRYEPVPYVIALPDRIFDGPALMVVIANGSQFGNGARIAPAARPDDGELDLVVVEPRSPARDALRARFLYDGSIACRPGITTARIREVRIADGQAPLRCHVDGEPMELAGPVLVRIRPALVLVRAP